MKKEYLIKLEKTGKYNIYYYINDVEDSIEFYGTKLEEPQLDIKQGYVKHKDSL